VIRQRVWAFFVTAFLLRAVRVNRFLSVLFAFLAWPALVVGCQRLLQVLGLIALLVTRLCMSAARWVCAASGQPRRVRAVR
jgi:hypothetical protein